MTSRVSFVKDSIDVILKLFILSLFLSAMLLWGYLHSINAKGLFLDAISSKEGLAAVLFVAVLMLVAFFLQMWMPSLVVVAASSMANGKLDEATDHPARYFIYVFIIWLALLMGLSMSFDGGWVIFAVLGATYAAATLLFLLRQRKKGATLEHVFHRDAGSSDIRSNGDRAADEYVRQRSRAERSHQ